MQEHVSNNIQMEQRKESIEPPFNLSKRVSLEQKRQEGSQNLFIQYCKRKQDSCIVVSLQHKRSAGNEELQLEDNHMSFSWLQGTPSIHWILHHTATEQIPIMSFNSVEITLEGIDHSSLNKTTKDDWTWVIQEDLQNLKAWQVYSVNSQWSAFIVPNHY